MASPIVNWVTMDSMESLKPVTRRRDHLISTKSPWRNFDVSMEFASRQDRPSALGAQRLWRSPEPAQAFLSIYSSPLGGRLSMPIVRSFQHDAVHTTRENTVSMLEAAALPIAPATRDRPRSQSRLTKTVEIGPSFKLNGFESHRGVFATDGRALPVRRSESGAT